MTREERIRDILENVPDHKIEQLFRDMGIDLDLSGPKPSATRNTRTSEDMMFTNLYGDY